MGALLVLLLESSRLADSDAVVIFDGKFASGQPTKPFTKRFAIDGLDVGAAEAGVIRN